MEQQITLSKNIVNFFYKSKSVNSNFEISVQQQCYQLLKQNYFTTDKGKKLFNELKNEIENIVDEQKRNEIKKYLGNLFVDRIKVIDYLLDNSNQRYFNLCNASEDKIYFDPEISDEELNNIRLQLFNFGLNNIEINTLESFMNPQENSKLNHQYIVCFEKDKQYRLEEIIYPFIRYSNSVKIIDNYIANNKAIYHFTKLLKKVNNTTKIELVTQSKTDYLKGKENNEYASKNYEDLSKLIEKYNIKLIINEMTGHLERYIITDKFEISLPGGFDQFNVNGSPIFKNENTILKMVISRKKN